MASVLGIYGRMAGSRIRAQAQYRASFIFQVVGAFIFSAIDYVMIVVLFTHLPSLAGWSLGEISFLYGTSYVTFRATDMVMTNLDRLPMLIRLGTLDQVLTRPLGSLGQVLTLDVDARHVGGMVQGAAIFTFALGRVSIDWTPERVIVFASMLCSGVLIFGAIWVAMNSIAFWTTDAREVANAFTYGGNYLTNFPLHIFGRWLRRILVFVVPVGFVNYFPSLYILGKPDQTGSPAVFRFLSPVAAACSVVVAGGVWRLAVRHYRSTGS